MDRTITREFDVSHLNRTCTACGEFGRFVNTAIVDKLDTLNADPPTHLHWDQLDRTQKLLIAEHIVRRGYSIDDFDGKADNDANLIEADAEDRDAEKMRTTDCPPRCTVPT